MGPDIARLPTKYVVGLETLRQPTHLVHFWCLRGKEREREGSNRRVVIGDTGRMMKPVFGDALVESPWACRVTGLYQDDTLWCMLSVLAYTLWCMLSSLDVPLVKGLEVNAIERETFSHTTSKTGDGTGITHLAPIKFHVYSRNVLLASGCWHRQHDVRAAHQAYHLPNSRAALRCRVIRLSPRVHTYWGERMFEGKSGAVKLERPLTNSLSVGKLYR